MHKKEVGQLRNTTEDAPETMIVMICNFIFVKLLQSIHQANNIIHHIGRSLFLFLAGSKRQYYMSPHTSTVALCLLFYCICCPPVLLLLLVYKCVCGCW